MRIGYLGLGAMGGPMACNLARAGHEVLAWDPVSEALKPVVEAGGKAAENAESLVEWAEFVCTSLPYPETFAQVAAETIVPHIQPGSILIDFTTSQPAAAIEIAKKLEAKACSLLEAPVSGGPGGSQQGMLRVFAGGPRATFDKCLPLLEVIGDPNYVVYCGEQGCGQIAKVVNQLSMGLTNAIMIESLVFGLRQGIDLETLDKAVGGSGGFRGEFSKIANIVRKGDGTHIGVKADQLGHFLETAHNAGVTMPISEALHAYLKDKPKITTEANRPSPSYFHEMMEE